MSGSAVSQGTKVVRPLMSLSAADARRRAISLYKDYYRFIPTLIKRYDMPKTEQDCRAKIREHFYKYACLTDVRLIDMLLIKGYINLQEMTNNFQQKGYVFSHWKPSIEPKPTDFIGKFIQGED